MAHIDPAIEETPAPQDQQKLDRDWYVGAYVTRELKLALQAEARAQRRTVSQQIILILEERYSNERTTEDNGKS